MQKPLPGGEPEPPPPVPGVVLRPAWLWIVFTILAFAIPIAGWLLERTRP